jgi:hypothetical protein
MPAARRAIVCSVAHVLLVALGCGGAHAAPPSTAAKPAPAASASTSTAGQTLHWSGRLTAGRTIELRTVTGSVRAVASSDDTAVIDATLTPETGDGDRTAMRIREDASGVSLRSEARGDRDDGCSCDDHGAKDRRAPTVDVVVHVPAGLQLVVHTVDARIDADGLRGPVDLRTVDGAIDVRAMASAHARTVNGAIHAAFAQPDLSEDTELSTVNGPVDVTLPASANAELAASTVNGQVHVDLPPAGSESRDSRGLRMTLGKGGRSLRVRTVNGSIRVKQG